MYWLGGLQKLGVFLLIVIIIRIFVDKTSSKLDFRLKGIKITLILSVVFLFDYFIKGAHKFSGNLYYNCGIVFYYFATAFVEEGFFRRFLMGSIIKLMKNPIIAIVVSGLFFGLSHVPFYVTFTNREVIEVLLTYLSGSTLHGIMWGYLYYKTGSIMPGVVTHAFSNMF